MAAMAIPGHAINHSANSMVVWPRLHATARASDHRKAPSFAGDRAQPCRHQDARILEHTLQAQVLSIDDALAAAEDARQDLVEVSPQASPPVCRLQDYNKAVYAAKLREKVG